MSDPSTPDHPRENTELSDSGVSSSATNNDLEDHPPRGSFVATDENHELSYDALQRNFNLDYDQIEETELRKVTFNIQMKRNEMESLTEDKLRKFDAYKDYYSLSSMTIEEEGEHTATQEEGESTSTQEEGESTATGEAAGKKGTWFGWMGKWFGWIGKWFGWMGTWFGWMGTWFGWMGKWVESMGKWYERNKNIVLRVISIIVVILDITHVVLDCVINIEKSRDLRELAFPILAGVPPLLLGFTCIRNGGPLFHYCTSPFWPYVFSSLPSFVKSCYDKYKSGKEKKSNEVLSLCGDVGNATADSKAGQPKQRADTLNLSIDTSFDEGPVTEKSPPDEAVTSSFEDSPSCEEVDNEALPNTSEGIYAHAALERRCIDGEPEHLPIGEVPLVQASPAHRPNETPNGFQNDATLHENPSTDLLGGPEGFPVYTDIETGRYLCGCFQALNSMQPGIGQRSLLGIRDQMLLASNGL